MKLLKDRIALVKSEMGWSNAELARQAGTSRTAPTDWLKGGVGDLSSSVAQQLSTRTPFNAMWLATGSGPKYQQARFAIQDSAGWPFTKVTVERFLALPAKDREEVEADFLYSVEKAEHRNGSDTAQATKGAA